MTPEPEPQDVVEARDNLTVRLASTTSHLELIEEFERRVRADERKRWAERALSEKKRLVAIGVCEVCWTNSWQPTGDEAECEAVHPHTESVGSDHIRCGYCCLTGYSRRWAEREQQLVGWLGALVATASAPSIGAYRDDFVAAWNEAQEYLASLNQERPA